MNIFLVIALAMLLIIILLRRHIPIGPAILAGGLLSFTAEATSALLEALRLGQGKRGPRAKLVIDDDQLRDLAPLISMVWLFDMLVQPTAPPFRCRLTSATYVGR